MQQSCTEWALKLVLISGIKEYVIINALSFVLAVWACLFLGHFCFAPNSSLISMAMKLDQEMIILASPSPTTFQRDIIHSERKNGNCFQKFFQLVKIQYYPFLKEFCVYTCLHQNYIYAYRHAFPGSDVHCAISLTARTYRRNDTCTRNLQVVYI